MRRSVAIAVLLLVLTGCRLSEILGLQWGDIRGNRIRLRDSKTGPRTVWLGDPVRAVIDTIPRQRDVPCVQGGDKVGQLSAGVELSAVE